MRRIEFIPLKIKKTQSFLLFPTRVEFPESFEIHLLVLFCSSVVNTDFARENPECLLLSSGSGSEQFIQMASRR